MARIRKNATANIAQEMTAFDECCIKLKLHEEKGALKTLTRDLWS